MYGQISINFTRPQAKKILQGKATIIKPHQVGTGHAVILRKKKINRITKKAAMGKGHRLVFEPDEIAMMDQKFGSGRFLDFLRDAGRYVKEKIIPSDFYQKTIRPIVRNVAESALETGTTFLPESIRDPARKIGQEALRAASESTSALGLRHQYGKSRNAGLPKVPPKGTALNVEVGTLPDMSYRGGSFTALGGSFKALGGCCRGGRLVRGSAEAKEYMAHLRSLRKRRK